MGDAKRIELKFISSQSAREVVRKFHYSGTVVNNSQLHIGIFFDGKCHGAMQLGPPFDKSKVIKLVKDTKWNEFLELNRMAFGPVLPRNSESRAIAIALKMIKANYPHIKWIISFADGTQCGDGTIYRAAGFLLTAIKKNTTIVRMPDGSVRAKTTFSKGKHILKNSGRAAPPPGTTALTGYQFRYIYLLDKSYKLNVASIPYSKIDELGVGMYKGMKRAGSKDNVVSGFQSEEGGANPTPALQNINTQVKAST